MADYGEWRYDGRDETGDLWAVRVDGRDFRVRMILTPSESPGCQPDLLASARAEVDVAGKWRPLARMRRTGFQGELQWLAADALRRR